MGRRAHGAQPQFHPISLDILPTALAAAAPHAATLPPFDGVDLLPFLAGANSGALNARL